MRGLHRAYMDGAVGLHLRPFLCPGGRTLCWCGFRAIQGLLRRLSGRCLRSVRVTFECRFMAVGIGEGLRGKKGVFRSRGYVWGYRLGLQFPKNGVTDSGFLGVG